MKVSIILPTYNRADVLHIPIESVLAQTYKDWELIIVDDGSTDNTEEVVNKYKDNRIKYIKSKKLPYYTIVRNKGIENSTGELLAFRDSDGAWDVSFLQEMIQPFKSEDVAMVYCGRKSYVDTDLQNITYNDIYNLKVDLLTRPSNYTGKESLSDKIDVGDIVISKKVFKDNFKGFTEDKDKSGYCSDSKLVDDIDKHNPLMKFIKIDRYLHFYFYKHNSCTENMTYTKIKDREQGKFETELEAKWDY